MAARGEIALPCPHCEQRSVIRSSRSLSLLSREMYYQCTNVECGHTWVALISIIRTIVPSQRANPKVYIPVSDRPQSDRTHPAQPPPTD